MDRFDQQVVTLVESPARARLVLRGEFDLSNAAPLTRSIRNAGWASRVVELDIRAVTFIDSSGLQALIVAQSTLRETGDDVLIVSASHPVATLIHLAALEDDFGLASESTSPHRLNRTKLRRGAVRTSSTNGSGFK